MIQEDRETGSATYARTEDVIIGMIFRLRCSKHGLDSGLLGVELLAGGHSDVFAFLALILRNAVISPSANLLNVEIHRQAYGA